MSSPDSGRSISSSLPISELIKHIKHSFRERDFNEVQKILMDRENGMKIEMQNLEKRACLLERSVDLKELERLKVDEKLQKTQRKCEGLEEIITGLIEEKRVSNDREERAQERCDKIAAENFKMKYENHKLISELNDNIKELRNKNSENEGLAGVCREKYKRFNTMAVKMGQEIEDLRHEKLAVVKTLEELRLKQLEGDRVVEELKLENLEANKTIDELRLKKSESDKEAESYKCRFENLWPKFRKMEEQLADMATVKVGDIADLVYDVRNLASSEKEGILNFPNSKGKNDRSGNGTTPDDAEDVVILSSGVRSSGSSKKGNRKLGSVMASPDSQSGCNPPQPESNEREEPWGSGAHGTSGARLMSGEGHFSKISRPSCAGEHMVEIVDSDDETEPDRTGVFSIHRGVGSNADDSNSTDSDDSCTDSRMDDLIASFRSKKLRTK